EAGFGRVLPAEPVQTCPQAGEDGRFDTGHPVVLGDQTADERVRTDSRAGAGGFGEAGVEHLAGRALALGAVAARRGRGHVTEAAGGLAAGIVEVVLVARVGRLVRAQARVERHT